MGHLHLSCYPGAGVSAQNGVARSRSPGGYGRVATAELPDGDRGVEYTVDRIRQAVLTDRHDPQIRAFTIQIIRGIHPTETRRQAAAIFAWVLENIAFVHDPVNTELVQSAKWTLTYRSGDCDCLSNLIATMAESVGIVARFNTVSLAGAIAPTGEYVEDHIYPELFCNGEWVPLDRARNRPEFGVTTTSVYRRRVWEIEPEGENLGKLAGGYLNMGDDSGDNIVYYNPAEDTSFTTDANGKMTYFTGLPQDGSTVLDANTGAVILPGFAGVTGTGPGAVPAGMTAQQIAGLITQGGNAAANVIRSIQTPGSPYYNPSSPYFRVNPNNYASGSTFAGISTPMLLGGAVLLAFALKR